MCRGVSMLRLCRGLVYLASQLLDVVAVDVVVVLHELVDVSLGGELDDAVGYGLDELVVVGCEEDVALVLLEVVVERLDGLEVEVVGRRVEDEAVGVLELHARYHAAHLLASGEDVDFLEHFFAAEEHAAEVALEEDVVAFAVLAEPLDEVFLALEELGVVNGKVGGGDGDAPLVGACLRLAVAVDDFEEGGHGARVVGEEHDFLAFLHVEGEVLEKYGSVVFDGCEPFDFKYLVSGFSLHGEDDAWVFACGWENLVDVELFEHLLARGGLVLIIHTCHPLRTDSCHRSSSC